MAIKYITSVFNKRVPLVHIIKMLQNMKFVIMILGILLISFLRNVSCQSVQPSLYCPLRCICSKQVVRCMFLTLEKVPEIPHDTTILDLRFNRIREIPPKSFQHLANLDTLLLNNNLITTLKNGAFDGLTRLKYLYLYKNRIRDIESDVFRDLVNLEQLYLHYNLINEIQGVTFSNMTSLERLFLHNNKIQRIPRGSFDNLDRMKRLRLDSNALVCDCAMVSLADMLVAHPNTQAAATCQYPSNMQGKPVTALREMKLHCRMPVITEEPRDIEVNFGTTVYFNCKADGDPVPNIVWSHNSNEISTVSEPRYSILNDGTLMIVNAQDEDAGSFECMAKSTVGEAKSRQAKMQYKKSVNKIRPRFIEAPSDQYVSERADVLLKCEAVGVPTPDILWAHNEKPVTVTQKFELTERGSLVIKNLTKIDEGVYRCAASNILGKISAVAEVRVQVPPVWSVTPVGKSVQIGSSFNLRCEASGEPTPIMTWMHNGQKVVSLPSSRIAITSGGQELRVNTSVIDDEGEYTCIAENAGGRIEFFTNIRALRGSPPVFTHRELDSTTIVGAGRQIKIPCSASGNPTPAIIWRKGPLTVIENSRISILPSGTLIINRFDPINDNGIYECVAFNDHGVITNKPIRLETDSIHILGRENVEDSILYNAVSQARHDVEAAENETLEILFGNMSKSDIKSPYDLLRLARFPRAEARNIARSAEIYERALQIIVNHVENGMNFSHAGEYAYNDLLTTTQLEALGRFSGCISHKKLKTNCKLEMCFHAKYRTIDGACNNLNEPMWGTAYTPFQRLRKAIYENGFNLPIGWTPGKLYNDYVKPYARTVSRQIVTTERITPDSVYTHMLMQWGQFLDHDLDHALPSLSIESYGERISCRRTCQNVAPCFPMPFDDDDLRIRTRKCMEFTRSASICGSGVTSFLFDTIQQREQINQLTSFIDASQVYGSSEEEVQSLRSTSEPRLLRKGIYLYPNKALMPFATDDTPVDCRRNFRESDVGCFLGGDIRVNEQLGLLAMHTVWFRQHNFVAETFKELNPSWNDETIFQEARKIVGAQMQHITYVHWLPFVIGSKGMSILGPYTGYDPQVNPTITTEFATAALRFGHTLINPVLRRLDANFQTIREGDLPLRNAFFAPWRLVEEGGLDPVMRGLFATSAKLKKPQELLNSHLTEELFTHAHAVALDLAAMNIQRARDHGIPSYNEYRVLCKLSRATSFDDLKNEIPDKQLRDKLRDVYNHVDNIDLWVGGIAEEPDGDDARVGPTFRCILIDQFKRLRDGDRFWYENPSVFRSDQLTQIKQTSLARILCDNGDALSHIKRDVFFMDSELVRCEQIPSVQFGLWTSDCCGEETPNSSIPSDRCPNIQFLSGNSENNQIRRRRHTKHKSKKNILLNIVNDSKFTPTISKVELQYGSSLVLSRIEETLSKVKSTVVSLQNRISELEHRCGK